MDPRKKLLLKAIAGGLPVPVGVADRTLEFFHLRRLLRALDINCVLDVGANRGQFALELRGIGYRGAIVSFEPLESEFRELERSFGGDRHWRGYCMALGERSGRATINVIPGLSVMNSLLQVAGKWPKVELREIEIRRLDEVCDEALAGIAAPRVLLKMDTQGYDLQVFAGAGRCLQHALALQSELSVLPLYKDMPHYLQALATYEGAGFELYNLAVVSRARDDRLQELNCLMKRRPA